MDDRELVEQTILVVKEQIQDIEDRVRRLDADRQAKEALLSYWQAKLDGFDGNEAKAGIVTTSSRPPTRKLPRGYVKKKVLDYFREHPGEWTPTEIASAIGINSSSIRYAMIKAPEEFKKDEGGIFSLTSVDDDEKDDLF